MQVLELGQSNHSSGELDGKSWLLSCGTSMPAMKLNQTLPVSREWALEWMTDRLWLLATLSLSLRAWFDLPVDSMSFLIPHRPHCNDFCDQLASWKYMMMLWETVCLLKKSWALFTMLHNYGRAHHKERNYTPSDDRVSMNLRAWRRYQSYHILQLVI